MSWNNFEYSTSDGRPFTLYEFIRGGAKHYRYTNIDKDININGKIWQTQAIKNSGFSIGTSRSLEITLPAVNEVAKLFCGVPPSEAIQIMIYRLHIDDDAAEMRVVWVGSIQETKREEEDRVKFITTNLAASFSRAGLRLTYGRDCPYAVYEKSCGVNKSDFAISNLVIDDLNGAEISVTLPASIDDDYFSGGFMEWSVDGIIERRGLKNQNGNMIGVLGGTHGLKKGLTITLYPGCDRTIETCHAKFSNHLNYGGQPHMPGMSPYQIIKVF